VRCVDVAALVTAAILRGNRLARVLPFEDKVVDIALDPYARVAANAQLLAAIPSGGTNVSAPLARLNAERAKVDLVVIVSDNQSWIDAVRGGATQTMREWDKLKNRNPGAKLICIDLQPYGTTQASGRADILNVGGFSDAVFDTIARFARDETRDWVEIVKQTEV
jgi:60 kDa SS-A/Ro ribonucleoprotein